MIIILMCGGGAKGLATTGSVVSPSSHKMKLSSKLIAIIKKVHQLWVVEEEDIILCV